jgi:hypothetical protein
MRKVVVEQVGGRRKGTEAAVTAAVVTGTDGAKQPW